MDFGPSFHMIKLCNSEFPLLTASVTSHRLDILYFCYHSMCFLISLVWWAECWFYVYVCNLVPMTWERYRAWRMFRKSDSVYPQTRGRKRAHKVWDGVAQPEGTQSHQKVNEMRHRCPLQSTGCSPDSTHFRLVKLLWTSGLQNQSRQSSTKPSGWWDMLV